MKILGVGFNYRPHVAEAPQLGLPEQAVDTPPLFFHKGDALLKPRTPFFLPDMVRPSNMRRSWSSRSVG